jgi:DnaJ domain
MNLYEVLGLERSATPEQIKTRYRQLALEYHPDRHHGENTAEYENRMAKISEAYEILSDPEQRHDYDQILLNAERGFSEFSSSGMKAPPYGSCSMCASQPAVFVTLRGQQGLILRRRHMEFSDSLCRNCGLAMFRIIQNRTMIQGWWGVTAFFLNFFTILGNLGALALLRSISPPTSITPGTTAPLPFPAPMGRPLLFRSGVWISIFALTIATLITYQIVTHKSSANSSANTSVNAPSSNPTTSTDPLAVGKCVTASGQSVTGIVNCSQSHFAQIVGIGATQNDCPNDTTQYFSENSSSPNPGRVICLDSTK